MFIPSQLLLPFLPQFQYYKSHLHIKLKYWVGQKVCLSFSITSYRKTQTKFLAKAIVQELKHVLNSSRKEKGYFQGWHLIIRNTEENTAGRSCWNHVQAARKSMAVLLPLSRKPPTESTRIKKSYIDSFKIHFWIYFLPTSRILPGHKLIKTEPSKTMYVSRRNGILCFLLLNYIGITWLNFDHFGGKK